MSRWALLPWWGRALTMWAASRLVSTALLMGFAAIQDENPYTGPSPGLADFSMLWDARWYEHIVRVGYPDVLPLDAAGRVDDNAWAFMPVYPMLIRTFTVLGLDIQTAALGISWVSSAVAAVLVAALFRQVVPRHADMALALVLLGPVAPVLQLGYAESLHLALLAGALLALRHRRWLLLAGLIPAMALTRPSGLAFALTAVIVLLWSWRQTERQAWSRSARWALAATAGWATIWGFAWPVLAAMRTGRIDAYVATELGWRAPYVGDVHDVVPGAGWVSGAEWWLGGAGLTLLALLVGGVAWVMARPLVRAALGVEGWAWVLAYLLYLLAVWFPQSSTFRILLPTFPLAAALAVVVPARAGRAALLAACVLGQVVWLWICWSIVGVDWTVP